MTPDRRALLLQRCAVRSAIFEAQLSEARAQAGPTEPQLRERVGFAELLALSPRQTDVVQLAADGSTNVEIAATLAISLETVKAHMAHASERLGTRNRAGSVAVALRAGFIE
jgi:DNA-binding NarL/FixJ family response regulator